MGLNGLTIAVPRGALMKQTLDLLDGLGVDTSEVRANDRRLLFGEVGIVTMRPSDVPTYVEAGAADLGITGKDVLAEQVEREVYELVDLGYGRCVMVFATVEGDDPAAEALRRLGVMRVATKYPRIAAALLRAHRPPGGDRRGQGLGRARAADRARRGHRRPHRHGHDAARERARHPRGDLGLDRAPDRQPGRAQAEGRGDRRDPRPDPRCGVAARSPTPPRWRRRCARRCRRPNRSPTTVAAIVEDVRLRGQRRGGRVRVPVRLTGSGGACRPSGSRAALDALDPDVRQALKLAAANIAAVAAAGLGAEHDGHARRRASPCGCATSRCGARRSTRPAAGLRTRRRCSWARSPPAPPGSTRWSWPRRRTR